MIICQEIMTDSQVYNNFIKLLSSNDYVAVEYFVGQAGQDRMYCKLIKVIHIISGEIFFILVSKKYKLALPSELINKYTIKSDKLHNNTKSSSFLSENYPMIQMNTTEDQIINNISDKLKSNYKQQIELTKNSSYEQIEQIKRMKYCFKTLEYKVLIQTCRNLIYLNRSNEVEVFEVEHYPNHQMRAFFPVITFEQFFQKIQVIHTVVKEIIEQFCEILNINQQKHNEHMTSKFIDNFITNNSKLLIIKTQLKQTQNDISTVLQKLQKKENEYLQKIDSVTNQSKQSGNIYSDANNSRLKQDLYNSYEKIHHTKLQIIDKMIQLDNRLKHIYLVIDDLGFNLSVALNELRNELNIFLQ